MADSANRSRADEAVPARPKKILVVEDDGPIIEAIAYNLLNEGFRVNVAMNAEACMRSFREDRPDLIVLDVMLPSASGFQVCQSIRAASDDIPIILLTARTDERDKVRGLDLGADDYITKPFSVRELVARIHAVLRRAAERPVARLTVADLEIDEAGHDAWVRGEKVELAPKEFALLLFLARHPGIVFSRQTLLDRVWGADAYVDERTVDVHIRWLRAKIERDPAHPIRLITVRGLGYKLSLGE